MQEIKAKTKPVTYAQVSFGPKVGFISELTHHTQTSKSPFPSGLFGSTQARQHSKFEEDSFSHYRDMSNKTFKKILHLFRILLFTHFAKIPITRACVLQSS